ncbi:MAG: IclR family transcriptional regulator [Litoreibacter sp.]
MPYTAFMKKIKTEKGMASARVMPTGNLDTSKLAKQEDARKGVQSVEQAFKILSAFEKSDRALAIKDIADALCMPASKIHHYLVSLVRSDVLRKTRMGMYELGPFALHLGLSAMRKIEPIELAAQTARELRNETGEAIFISVWGSFGPTIVRYYEGFQPVTVEVRAGLVLPLLTSATGKVFLAWSNPSAFEEPLRRETAKQADVDRIIKETQKAGVGGVDGDLLPRIASVSAPVFDRDKRLALAITMLGWSGDFDPSLDGDKARTVKQAADNLSHQLGYST